jgi:hypothetical protein
MALVIDLSSSLDDEDLIAATSYDFEFAQRLFGKLNRVEKPSSLFLGLIVMSH